MLEIKKITDWMDAQAALLSSDGLQAEVIQSALVGDNPSVRLDASSDDTMGRIIGWQSGEFNFEVIRVADEVQSLDVYIRARSLADVEAALLEFRAALGDLSIAPRKYSKDWVA